MLLFLVGGARIVIAGFRECGVIDRAKMKLEARHLGDYFGPRLHCDRPRDFRKETRVKCIRQCRRDVRKPLDRRDDATLESGFRSLHIGQFFDQSWQGNILEVFLGLQGYRRVKPATQVLALILPPGLRKLFALQALQLELWRFLEEEIRRHPARN